MKVREARQIGIALGTSLVILAVIVLLHFIMRLLES
jgi:hypothetical protein